MEDIIEITKIDDNVGEIVYKTPAGIVPLRTSYELIQDQIELCDVQVAEFITQKENEKSNLREILFKFDKLKITPNDVEN